MTLPADTEFTASNGLRVSTDARGAVGVEWASPWKGGWVFHDPAETIALQEFFAAHRAAQEPSEEHIRAVTHAVYGPHSPAQWERDNARDAITALRGI